MHPTYRRSSATILVLILGVTSLLADGVLLRFRPAPEITVPFTMTSRSAIDLSMGAMGSQKMTNDASLDLHLDVVDVSASGEVTMDFTYDRFRIEAESFGQTTVFDSDGGGGDSGAGQVNDLLTEMTGKPVRVTVDDRGRIGKVEGLDELFDGMTAELGADPRTAPLVEIIRGSVSDEAVRGLMQQALVVFPEGEVAPGQSWNNDVRITNPMVGGLAAAYRYRFAGEVTRDGKSALELDFDLVMTHDGTNPLLEQMANVFRAQGAQVEVGLDMQEATGSGTIWIEPDTGLPVELEMNQKMNLAIDIEMTSGGQPQTMNMKMDVDTDTSMKRTAG